MGFLHNIWDIQLQGICIFRYKVFQRYIKKIVKKNHVINYTLIGKYIMRVKENALMPRVFFNFI